MWKELVLKRPVIGKLLSKHYNSLFTNLGGGYEFHDAVPDGRKGAEN